MIMLGMQGWKIEVHGSAADLKRYDPGPLERILDRIFGGKMLAAFAIAGGRPILIKRSEILVAEVKEDPPAKGRGADAPADTGPPEPPAKRKFRLRIPRKARPA
jgi:hypothetical protein